jgi:hypothetical protein
MNLIFIKVGLASMNSLLAAVPAKAVWYGAVGKAAPKDGHALGIYLRYGVSGIGGKTTGALIKS